MSKLINDILTIWLYQATPRAALDYFYKEHCPPFQKYHGPRAFLTGDGEHGGFNLDMGLVTEEQLRATLEDRIDYRVGANAARRGFVEGAYEDGIDYRLPPFPKDMPPGYLASIGWTKAVPKTEPAKWLEWAAQERSKLPS